MWYEAELELKALGAGADQLLLLVQRRLLKLSTGRDLGELLHAEELQALYDLWESWQGECHPSQAKLQGWLRRRVCDTASVRSDGWRAYEAKTAAAYYGRPEVDLTDGQVAYWHLLSAAYAEWYVPGASGRRKVPTKKWLNSDDE